MRVLITGGAGFIGFSLARRLLARGRTALQWARVTCPIGASAGIRSKEPGAIAIAVATELLTTHEAAAARHVPLVAAHSTIPR